MRSWWERPWRNRICARAAWPERYYVEGDVRRQLYWLLDWLVYIAINVSQGNPGHILRLWRAAWRVSVVWNVKALVLRRPGYPWDKKTQAERRKHEKPAHVIRGGLEAAVESFYWALTNAPGAVIVGLVDLKPHEKEMKP